MNDYYTMGGHGIIIGLLLWVVKHLRRVKVDLELKNGNGGKDDNGVL